MRCPTLKELSSPPLGKTGWPWTEESPQLPDTMPDGSPWPRISIVTPSLNQGQFIEETIRSVLLQGYPDLEYIIIDGGSTDGSVEIIKKYEKWLAYWISELDNGQASAINKGFRKATGKIAAWLNSDDYYEKGIMGYIARLLSENKSDFIYGDINIVDEKGDFISKHITQEFDLIKKLYVTIIPQPSCFWLSHVFHDMGFLDEQYNYVFDNEFWIRCGIKKKFRYKKLFLANYRMHRNTKTSSQHLNFMAEAVKMFNNFFLSLPLPPKYILEHKNKVLAFWNERLAHTYYKTKFMKEARYHFNKAIFWTPFRIQNLTLIFYIIDTIFGLKFGKIIQTASRSLRDKINSKRNSGSVGRNIKCDKNN